MTQDKSVTEILAHLLLLPKVAPQAIAIAGEAITADGLLMQHPSQLGRKLGHKELGEFLEAYDAVSQRCESIVKEYSQTQDWKALISGLSEINTKLIELQNIGEKLR